MSKHFANVAEQAAKNHEECLKALLEGHKFNFPQGDIHRLEEDVSLAMAQLAEAQRRADRVAQGLAPDPFPTTIGQG